MKAAVLFDNLGPYHWARLRAAAGVFDLLALEVAARSAVYAWERSTEDGKWESEDSRQCFAVHELRVVTLLEGGTGRNASRQELKRRLNPVLDDFEPQAVCIPGWSSRAALLALAWCADKQVPAVAMSESTEWDEPRSARREAVKKRIVRLFSAALVGGQPQSDYLVKLGMPGERIFLGYDAVDNDYFRNNSEQLKSEKLKSETRTKYGLPQNYFLASARFIEKKNLPRLLQAYALYRHKAETLPREVENQGLHGLKKAEMWDLVLLGDGELRPALNAQRSTLNLHEHVQMPGFKQYPDLPVYFGLAGAFIHASTTEQWGLVVNEAMASGLPVLVSSRCGCARDLVHEGLNGFTFDPYNVEELAQLMFKISAFNDSSSPPRPGRGIQGEVSNSNSEPSSIVRPPAPTLAEMGAASQSIISNWGPERFASGLKSAAEKAAGVGPVKAGMVDRLLLESLIRR